MDARRGHEGGESGEEVAFKKSSRRFYLFEGQDIVVTYRAIADQAVSVPDGVRYDKNGQRPVAEPASKLLA